MYTFSNEEGNCPPDPMPEEEPRCYTVSDIQTIMGISRRSVYTLLEQGKFPSIRIGNRYRIPKKAFDTWLDSPD